MPRYILALSLTLAAADHPCEAPPETDRLIRAWRITFDDMRLDREQRLAPAMNGKKWTLADLKGKRTFINFWATWCGPCIVELPWVELLHLRLKGEKTAQVLTINADENRALVEPFLRVRALTFTVLPARDFVTKTLKVDGFPTSWIVDADGMVRNEQLGFVAEPARWMEDVLEKLKAK